jgi:hypothetical protein
MPWRLASAAVALLLVSIAASAPPVEGASSTPPRRAPEWLKFKVGAEFYLRGQSRFNAKLDPTRGDREHAILQRARISADASAGPVRAFVQFQDARQWGFERSSVANMANTDLHQGFLEIGGEAAKRGPRGWLRVGRQEVILGGRLLLADNNWNPNAQAFDGARALAQVGRFGVDVGAFMLGPPGDFTVSDASGDPAATSTLHSRGSYLGYASFSADLHPAIALEAQAFGALYRPTAAEPTRRRELLDLSGRARGEPLPGLSYVVEGHGQVGAIQGREHRAWLWFAELRQVARSIKIEPGAYGRLVWGSGEACEGAPPDGCNGRRSRDFYRFYGFRHAVYGQVDMGGLANVRDLALGGVLAPHKNLHLDAGYNLLQLDQASGRWIDAFDNVMGAGWDPQNRARNLGQELHVNAEWRALEHLRVQAGYGVFLPMVAGRRLLGPAPLHFAYLWVIATF